MVNPNHEICSKGRSFLQMKEKKEKKKSSFFKDFKAFITKGNILDLAVAVVIGGAFNAIITALVNNILMPIVGLFTGKASLADLDEWDSLAMMATMAFLDQHFGVKVKIADLKTLATIGDIATKAGL